MWPALAASGVVVTLSGLFFLVFGPLGLLMLLAGPIMIAAGLLLKDPRPPVSDDPNMKMCSNCYAEFDRYLAECPDCGFPAE